MGQNVLAGLLVAACAAVIPLGVDAQGRGRGVQERLTPAEFAASEDAQRLVARARKIGAPDLLKDVDMFCTATGPLRPALVRQQAGLERQPSHVVEPTRVFDNMYYIGFSDQNAWAISTSDGIILIDTLNSGEEARDVLVPGLRKVGLDPARIKYIVVLHGHPGQSDHTGGALYLQQTYGAKVIMAAADWEQILLRPRPDRPMPKRDIDAAHGQKLTLGDTTLTLLHTPGHTPGSMGVLVPVTHRGAAHTAIVFGGTQMPTREALVAFERAFDEHARPQKAEAALNSHAGILSDTLAQLEQVRRHPEGPHPFLYGPARFDRYLSIMTTCAEARLAAMR